jgi:hypothetical protein
MWVIKGSGQSSTWISPGKEMQYGSNVGSKNGQLKQPKLDVKKETGNEDNSR